MSNQERQFLPHLARKHTDRSAPIAAAPWYPIELAGRTQRAFERSLWWVCERNDIICRQS